MPTKLQSKWMQAAIVIAIIALVVLTGTFAWNSFSQQRINVFNVMNTPNVNLHDDFAGGPEKDVYVENSGSQPTLVRVQLTELLIQSGALLPVDAIDNEQGSNWNVHSPLGGNCEVCSFPAHEYFTWEMNGQKFYMPAPSSAKGKLTNDEYIEPLAVGDLDEIIDYAALLREAFENDQFLLTYIDEYLSGDITNADYLQNAIENLPDSLTVPNIRQYDGQPEGELTRLLNEVRLTLIPEPIITMQGWIDDSYRTGNFWVMDTDGWCYWASPLMQGDATGQLLSSVDYVKMHDDDDLIYRINVMLNATTYADTQLNDFFQLAVTNGGISDEGKLLMLMISGEYVVGEDGELYIDEGGGLYSSYETGGVIFAGLDGVPGSGDDLAIGSQLTVAGTVYEIASFTRGVNGAVYLNVGGDVYLEPIDEGYMFVFPGEDGEIGSEDDGFGADPNYAGGLGTEESPFLIATKEQLAYMRNRVNDTSENGTPRYSEDKYFKQIANIDLGGEDSPWTPISAGLAGYRFYGSYDGDGYKISGLNVDVQSQPGGLFYYLEGGTLKNLAVEGSVVSNYRYVGGLVAFATSNSTISDCVFSGTVKGTYAIGGIVGYHQTPGVVRNCYVTYGSKIIATDGINGSCGGIIGSVGMQAITIESSYSLASVTGKEGLTGGIIGGTVSNGKATNCAFLQTAALNNTLNAICQIGAGTVNVVDVNPISDLTGDLLPLLNNGGTAWTQDAGSWPLPTVIRDRSFGTYSGDINYSGGKGTQVEPYLIATKDQLAYMRDRVNSGTDYVGIYFRQTANIDLNNEAWTPIGRFVSGAPDNVTFKGFYDGDGYSITKLLVNEEALMRGLFGDIDGGGISNLYVQGTIEFTKQQINYVGGIVGRAMNAYITDCVFSGSVKGYQYVGGIAGASNNSLVKNCFVTYGSEVANTATANDYGGVVGSLSSNSKLQSSYSLANISGKYENFAGGGIAGNIGATGGTVIDCAFLRTDTDTLNAVGNGGTVTNTGYFSELNSTLTATNGTTITAANLVALLDAGAEGSGKDWVQYTSGGSWPLPAKIRDKTLGMYTSPPTGDNENFAGGYGTQSEPYLIANKTQLEYLRNQVNANASFAKGKYFKQTAHIDLGGAAWKPIGVFDEDIYNKGEEEEFGIPFSGVYNGDGYKITGLNVPISPYNDGSGLFGYVRNATVQNLYVEGSVHSGYFVGGIVAFAMESDILNCVFSGTVTGDYYVGGIVGFAEAWEGKTRIMYCGVALGSTIICDENYTGGIGGGLPSTEVYSCYVLADINKYNGLVSSYLQYSDVKHFGYLKTGSINSDWDSIYVGGGTVDYIAYFANATGNVTITNSSGTFTGNLLALLNKGGEGQWRAAVGGENDGYPVLVVMK